MQNSPLARRDKVKGFLIFYCQNGGNVVKYIREKLKGGAVMLSYLAPDHYFDNFYEISPDFLLSLGCKYLFSDVDNTLAPYEVAEPDERISAWIRAVSDAGIVIVLVSNNGPERIELFNRTLGVRAYADCKKPSRKRLGAIMKELGATGENTVFLGDQIYTDVLSARRLGVHAAILVPPIRDKKSLFFRFKRLMERPVMWRFRRKQAKKNKA